MGFKLELYFTRHESHRTEYVYGPEVSSSACCVFPAGDGQCTSAVLPWEAEVAQACAQPRRWGFVEFCNWRDRMKDYGEISLWHGLLTCSFMFLELTVGMLHI